jgi:hypothetical protein
MLYHLGHPGTQLKLLHLLMKFPAYKIFFSNVNAKTSSQCKVTTWYSQKESHFEIWAYRHKAWAEIDCDVYQYIHSLYSVCVEDTRVYSVQQILFEGNNKKNWFCVWLGKTVLRTYSMSKRTFRDKARCQAAGYICSCVQKGLTVTGRCFTTEKETSSS